MDGIYTQWLLDLVVVVMDNREDHIMSDQMKINLGWALKTINEPEEPKVSRPVLGEVINSSKPIFSRTFGQNLPGMGTFRFSPPPLKRQQADFWPPKK